MEIGRDNLSRQDNLIRSGQWTCTRENAAEGYRFLRKQNKRSTKQRFSVDLKVQQVTEWGRAVFAPTLNKWLLTELLHHKGNKVKTLQLHMIYCSVLTSYFILVLEEYPWMYFKSRHFRSVWPTRGPKKGSLFRLGGCIVPITSLTNGWQL